MGRGTTSGFRNKAVATATDLRLGLMFHSGMHVDDRRGRVRKCALC